MLQRVADAAVPELADWCVAHIARAPAPSQLSDTQWAEFLFFRTNPKGRHAERWLHIHGCQRWFNAVRDTVTDRFEK